MKSVHYTVGGRPLGYHEPPPAPRPPQRVAEWCTACRRRTWQAVTHSGRRCERCRQITRSRSPGRRGAPA